MYSVRVRTPRTWVGYGVRALGDFERQCPLQAMPSDAYIQKIIGVDRGKAMPFHRASPPEPASELPVVETDAVLVSLGVRL